LAFVREEKMAEKNERAGGFGNIEGILGGIGDIITKLGELAEKGETLKRTGSIKWQAGGKDVEGVYGFSVRTGLGGTEVKVEPFGNIKRDEKSGRPVVEEFREPVADVFEEDDYILVVAEMPGVGVEDVKLDLSDDILSIHAEKGKKKYRKEILLPRICSREKLYKTCNNGMLEIRCES
jgi:HSP20 family protein